MSNIILFNFMTLDGFFEGENHDLSWHNVDVEFNDFAIEQLDSADALFFGRLTYELMASYWPSEEGIKDDPLVADRMNKITKFVFSKTLKSVEWNNTTLINKNIEQEVKKLKQKFDKNIFIFGSANFASTLFELDLIDEYRIMINPIILGKGIPLFKQNEEKIKLKLNNARIFNSGNVLMIYEPIR